MTRLHVATSVVLLIATALALLLALLVGGAVPMADGLFGPEEEMMIAAKALVA